MQIAKCKLQIGSPEACRRVGCTVRREGVNLLFQFAFCFLHFAWCNFPATANAQSLPAVIDFNRDIRPILADNCYQCHGPDKNKRKAQLRLDTREGLFTASRGTPPVVPGNPDQSELLRRVTTSNVTERMPDPKSGKSLSAQQIALLNKWIQQGAPWKGHWAFLPLVRPGLAGGTDSTFGYNPVDRFIEARLREAGLSPAAETDRVTLIRRLSFDLIGLPPSWEEVEEFNSDTEPDAYDRLVNQLLASPHYGERMSMAWLDLVRYADSIGYHSDNPMQVSAYRNYVIRAFNQNKPFDQFTVEQLAGDLLPSPTIEQKVASAYNRLLQTTEEGGAQAKEYEAKYAADRVRNASTVWLGVTMGCCQCHDHKFDPFSTRDFYRFAAFFADIQEAAVGRREPGMLVPSANQAARLAELDEKIRQATRRRDQSTPELEKAQAAWEKEQAAVLAKKAPAKQVPPAISQILGVAPSKRTPEQQRQLAAHYRGIAPLLQSVRDEIANYEKQKAKLLQLVSATLISTSVPPRVTRVLPRGNWLDETGEVVSPGVPGSLPPLHAGNPRPSRLDLARWIVSPENPLPARVFVNRLWKMLFGQGLSKTLDDLGAQGEWPTHPELLDWLAAEFRDSGWNVKHLVRLMVTSATYRRSSQPTAEQKERDPYNRLLAHQARFRLDAEIVRDNALAISGLLVRRIGGPSVKPYQPPGYWAALNFPPREWPNDHGDNLYRRGLYTHWQRSFLQPSLLAFDAPTREECICERARSNIPQQALVLLNDPTYVEAARVFAERIMTKGGSNPNNRLTWAFEQALSRKPLPQERTVLMGLHDKHLNEYASKKEDADRLVHVGDAGLPRHIDGAELAAWTSVARVVLNLHELITRE